MKAPIAAFFACKRCRCSGGGGGGSFKPQMVAAAAAASTPRAQPYVPAQLWHCGSGNDCCGFKLLWQQQREWPHCPSGRRAIDWDSSRWSWFRLQSTNQAVRLRLCQSVKAKHDVLWTHKRARSSLRHLKFRISCRFSAEKRNDFFLNYLMEATLDICSFPFNAAYVCQSSATSLQQKTIISTANTIIGFTEGRLGAPSMVSSKDAMEEKKTNRTIGAIKGFIEALKNARRKPRIPKTVSISVWL